jgi:hypothetical protein
VSRTTPSVIDAGVGVSVRPRLLSVKDGARYVGLSFWTLRDYILQGLIPTVTLPPLRPREGAPSATTLRRVLVDIRDLDRFVESCKPPEVSR